MTTRAVVVRRSKPRRSAKKADAETKVAYPLTNPGRVLYPADGITKLELAKYYEQVADRMLPYLADRPLSLLRCPEGQAKACFFQKHAAAGTPDVLRRIEITEKDGPETYLIADDLPGLLSLAQMGVLEIHLWGARADRLGYPDWFVIDLDPAPDVAWKTVVETGLFIRDWLDKLELTTFAKLTGGKGLHVVAPLAPRRSDWDRVKSFTQSLAQTLAETFPDRFIAKMSKAARRGKIFIDYLRNDQGSTAIAPYSARANEQAAVAIPISWKELSADTKSGAWTVRNLSDRFPKLKKDPWQDFFENKQTLPKSTTALRTALRKLA